MKQNGDYELSDVPRLLKKYRDSRCCDWRALLGARAALMDACEGLMDTAAHESRGLNTGERNAFDGHVAQVREINADLAKIKAALVAENGASMVHVPF